MVAPVIDHQRERIAQLCRAFSVRRLYLFGSATGTDFDPARSDVDLLVEFEPTPDRDPWAFFDFNEQLEALIGRPVDLVEPEGVRNRHYWRGINASRELLYEA